MQLILNAACTIDYCIIFNTGTKCMTADGRKGTLKCSVSRASHDETCSLGGNGNYIFSQICLNSNMLLHKCNYMYYV